MFLTKPKEYSVPDRLGDDGIVHFDESVVRQVAEVVATTMCSSSEVEFLVPSCYGAEAKDHPVQTVRVEFA